MKTIKRLTMMLVALIATTGAWAQFSAANGGQSLTPSKAGKASKKAPTVDGNWLYYDDGTYATNIGTGGGTVYWGIMLPAATLPGNTLEKVAVFENDYNTDDITIAIYSGGDTAPAGDAIYTETVTPVGGEAFHEITLATPVAIDQTKNLWIVLSENGTYPAGASVDGGDANGRWISLDGSEWLDVANAGISGYCWMLRAGFGAGVGATYQVGTGTSEHGTLTFAVDGETVTEAPAGKTVTVTVAPTAPYSVDKITANAYVDWSDAQIPGPHGISILKEIELTPAGNNTWTFIMPEANVEVNVDYQKDIVVTMEAGGDITAALNEAAEGLPIHNLNLTLKAGEYTVTEPLTANGNVVITGAGAGDADTSGATVIDASALDGAAFISYTTVDGEIAKKDDGTDSPYTIVENVKIVGVNIKGLAKSVFNNAAGKVLFQNFIVDNSIIEIVGNNTVFALGNGFAANASITKSTIWSKAGHQGFFFQAQGRPKDVSSTTTTTTKVDQCDLYNIAVGKKANNNNSGIKGQKTTTMILTKAILYNFGSSKGNEVNGWLWGQNSTSLVTTYNKNCYWSEEGEVAGWTDASKGGSDQTGTAVVGEPFFKDAANGDFSIGGENWNDEPSKARIGDPRWLGVFQPEGVTLPLELMPLDGADLYTEIDEGYSRSIAPAYINVTLRPGAHYTVSQPIEVNTTINFIGDENNPAVVDLSECTGPMLQYSSSLLPAFNINDKGFYEEPFNVSFKNIIFACLNNPLFSDNKQPYLIGYFTMDNCIVEVTAKESSKKVFDFTGGGVAEHFTITNSTIYGKEKNTEVQLYSSQGGKKATEAGVAMQYFTLTNSTMYNIAYKKNLNSHRQNNQKWLSYTILNNVILDCGKKDQFCKGMNGGQGGQNPAWMVQYNSFMWTNDNGMLTDTNEDTGDPNEPVAASYKNVYPETELTAIFPKWYSKDMYGNYSDFFRGNFTLAEGSVQKENSLGDPRWLKSDNEYTDIQAVDVEKAGEGEWYTIQGVRVNAPVKGLYIHNGKKVMVK